jgi:hypothetical protein
MSCGSSQTPGCLPCGDDDVECVQAQPVLPPAKCSDDANTKAEGPPGLQGDTGDTPAFTVGTVTEGTANVILTENTPTDYTVDFVIPQPPIDSENTWTAVQTYEQQAIFELGLETTGGTSTFGGTAFTVTPDAEFTGDVTVAGDEFVSGTLRVGGNATYAGNASVAGATFLNDTEIDGEITFGPSSTIVVSATGAGRFPRGILVQGDCGAPELLPGRGGDLYQKEDATGLVTIVAGDDDAISDAFVVAVPVSSCLPQVTPVVTVTARIGYSFDNTPNGAFTARLWRGAVTSGTMMDEVTIGVNTFDNTPAGCIFLESQETLAVGNTSFFVECDNNTDAGFVPQQVTFWAKNL